MNACAACREQIDFRMDDMLDAANEAQLASHLSTCAACRRYDAAQQALSGDLAALSRVAEAIAVRQPLQTRAIPNWMYIGRVAAALAFVVMCTWTALRQPSLHNGNGPRQNTTDPIVDKRPIRPPVQLAVSVKPNDDQSRFAIPIKTDDPHVHMVWLYDSASPVVDSAPASAPSS